MRKRPTLSGVWPEHQHDQLVTDSMILTETYVQSAVENQSDQTSTLPRILAGTRNGLILSVPLWALILLAILVF